LGKYDTRISDRYKYLSRDELYLISMTEFENPKNFHKKIMKLLLLAMGGLNRGLSEQGSQIICIY
jgi:hypothetical protein